MTNIYNSNGRIYPEDLFQKVLNEYKNKIIKKQRKKKLQQLKNL